MNWRILKIDWYEDGLIAHEAKQIVRSFFGPAVPLQIYWMLDTKQYRRIIRGFTLARKW
jgi:hypothetical protein